MANPIFQGQQEVYPQAKAQEILHNQEIAAKYGLATMGMMQDMQQNQAILVNQTNPNKIVDEIILTLQGKVKRDDGSIELRFEPFLNNEGIRMSEMVLRTLVNQGTTLSHLEKEDIGRIMEEQANSYADALALNWKEWGILDKSYIALIFNMVIIQGFTSLKRAEGQNEKNWLGRISVENINNAPRMMPPKKDSIFSKFKL